MPPKKNSVKGGAATPRPARNNSASVPAPAPVTPAPPPPQTALVTGKTPREIRAENRALERARRESQAQDARAQQQADRAEQDAQAARAAQVLLSTVIPTTTTHWSDSTSASMDISDDGEDESDQEDSMADPTNISNNEDNLEGSVQLPPASNIAAVAGVIASAISSQAPRHASQSPRNGISPPTDRRPSYQNLGSIGTLADGPVAQIARRGSSHRSSASEVVRTPRGSVRDNTSSHHVDATQTGTAAPNPDLTDRINQLGWVFPGKRPRHPVYVPSSPKPHRPASPDYTPTSPEYTPTSPEYTPTSPEYTPTSPRNFTTPPEYPLTPRGYVPRTPSYSPIPPRYIPGTPDDLAGTGPPQQHPKSWWEYLCEEVSNGFGYISKKRWQLFILILIEARILSSTLCSAGPICERHSRAEIAWRYLTDSYYLRLDFLANPIVTVLLMTELVDWIIGINRFIAQFGRQGVWYVPNCIAGAKAHLWHNGAVFGRLLLDECTEPLLLATTALNLSWNVGNTDSLSLFCSMAFLHFANWVIQASERYFDEQHNRFKSRGPWKRWIWVSVALILIVLNYQIWLTIPVQVWEWCFYDGICTKFPNSTVREYPAFTDTIVPTVTGNLEAALSSLLASTGLTLITTTIVV